MIFHRHDRGLVLDMNTSEACPQSKLDKHSRLGPNADVFQSILESSWVENSVVANCHLRETRILEDSITFNSSFLNVDVGHSKVYSSMLTDSTIHGVQARGSIISGCRIEADVQIGAAELIELEILQPMRIGTGVWTRAPRSFHLLSDSVNLIVTESTDGQAYVGCRRKPMETWIKGKERFRKIMGWDQEIIDQIETHFRTWLK